MKYFWSYIHFHGRKTLVVMLGNPLSQFNLNKVLMDFDHDTSVFCIRSRSISQQYTVSQKLKKPNFSSFFRLLSVNPKYLWNNSDIGFPGKFHPKELYKYVEYGKKKFSIPKRGLRIVKTTIFRCRTDNFFFSWEKFVVFFGVKFNGDYYGVAVIP